MFSTDPISANTSSCSSLAPPCMGPQSEATPAEMQAKGLANEEPAILTAVVEGPWSLSACKIKIFSK